MIDRYSVHEFGEGWIVYDEIAKYPLPFVHQTLGAALATCEG